MPEFVMAAMNGAAGVGGLARIRARRRPRLILCAHDLSRQGPADALRRDYWMPFTDFAALISRIDAAAASSGTLVELTIDDGFVSDHDRLLPWLMENGRRASFFVPTAFVGRPGHLDLAQLRAIHVAGMPVGLHGVDHLDWTKATQAELAREIVDGKARLEDMLGAPVGRAAPPYGAYDARVLGALREAGIGTIYSCNGGLGVAGQDGLLPRFVLRAGANAERAVALAAGGMRIRDLVRQSFDALQFAMAGR